MKDRSLDSFSPCIVDFCCWWCGYGAADLAGATNMIYPSNVKVVRVPCLGRVDDVLVMQTLNQGADGVMLTGCLESNCHHMDGSRRANARIAELKEMLKTVGLEGRVQIYLMTAAMADEYAKSVREFTDAIGKLGPNPLAKANRVSRETESME